jgi:hypothetical protein
VWAELLAGDYLKAADLAGYVATTNATYTQTVAQAAAAYGWGDHAGLYDTNGAAAAVSNLLSGYLPVGGVATLWGQTAGPYWSAPGAAGNAGDFMRDNGSGTTIWDALDAADISAAGGVTGTPWTAGFTATGSILTTRDFDTTAPASDEVPSAGWVRSLAMQGQEWFLTDTLTNGYGEKTTNFVAMAADSPTDIITNSIATVTSDTYLLGGVSTNTYGSLSSPVTVEIYANRVGGNTSSILPIKPEIYYVYDGETNQLGDWDTAVQTITATTPTKYTFTVAFVEPTLTGAVHLVAYLKSGTVSGTAAGLNLYGGGIYPSHLNIDGVAAGETTADVAANLASHLADTEDAHDASAISTTGTYSDVQSAIDDQCGALSTNGGTMDSGAVLDMNSGTISNVNTIGIGSDNGSGTIRPSAGSFSLWDADNHEAVYVGTDDRRLLNSNGTVIATFGDILRGSGSGLTNLDLSAGTNAPSEWTADTGATNIAAGASDSYDPGTRTFTWNTNAAAGGGTGAGDTNGLVTNLVYTACPAITGATYSVDNKTWTLEGPAVGGATKSKYVRTYMTGSTTISAAWTTIIYPNEEEDADNVCDGTNFVFGSTGIVRWKARGRLLGGASSGTAGARLLLNGTTNASLGVCYQWINDNIIIPYFENVVSNSAATNVWRVQWIGAGSLTATNIWNTALTNETCIEAWVE